MASELERDESSRTQVDDLIERPVETPHDDPIDIDLIMDELTLAGNCLPREAILAARRAPRELLVPRLIEAIQQAVADVREGCAPYSGEAPFFALYLLSELRAREALPVILEAVSLPEEGPFDVFDDAITEHVARAILTLADDPLPVMEELIANRDINQFVRWQGVSGYRYLVRDGRLSREEAVRRLLGHLRRGMEDDPEILTPVLSELTHYDAREGRDEIRAALESDAVEPYDVSAVDFRGLFDPSLDESAPPSVELSHLPPSQIDDTIAELEDWGSFSEPTYEDEVDEYYDDDDDLDDGPWPVVHRPEVLYNPWSTANLVGPPPADDDEPDYPPTERLTAGPRIGRNERCPCGSGKKFKKCCGARR